MQSEEAHALFAQVDQAIKNSELYSNEKEKRIEALKKQYTSSSDPRTRAEIGDRLIEEYESFISDSALYYVNENLKNPVVENDLERKTSLLILKADITAHAGLFGEAEDLLESIDRRNLADSSQLLNYYSAYCDLYQYQSEYTTDGEYARINEKLREAYIDSVTRVSSPASFTYIVNKGAALARNEQYEEAENMLLDKLGQYKSGDRHYSILASILAYVYKTQGEDEKYLDYLTRTVISDLEGSIKENMGIRELATICYEHGDIERADRYLRQSFADANFYSARMRNAQSSRMLPVIGEAYELHQKELTGKLRTYIMVISVLAGILALIIIYTVYQFVKVRRAHRTISRMLTEVSDLSEKLKQMNREVTEANHELRNSNIIKEEYAGLFMQYCALALSHLQQYHQSLRILASQGNMKNLIKKIDSTDIENKIVEEFYDKFDEAILNIFPNFIEKFNNLLQPESRITLKKGERLNTELRIYALIRIGITDSEKIAGFLRCSLSTIYTYRSKIKRRAERPETFEEDVKNIE